MEIADPCVGLAQIAAVVVVNVEESNSKMSAKVRRWKKALLTCDRSFDRGDRIESPCCPRLPAVRDRTGPGVYDLTNAKWWEEYVLPCVARSPRIALCAIGIPL